MPMVTLSQQVTATCIIDTVLTIEICNASVIFSSHPECIGLRLFADRYVRCGKDISKLSISVTYGYQYVWRTVNSKCGVTLSASVACG